MKAHDVMKLKTLGLVLGLGLEACLVGYLCIPVRNSKIVVRNFVAFSGNTKLQIDSYFTSQHRTIFAICDCFGRNDSFETTRERCMETMGSPPEYKQCVYKVFEYHSIVNSIDYASFFKCNERSSKLIANYFENNCSITNSGNYDSTLVYMSQFDSCEVDYATSLRIAACDEFDFPDQARND